MIHFYHRHTHHRALISDTRMVGGLLALLQFAGGFYLFLPNAQFLPPFHKLCELIPSWGFAIYFILSGAVGGVATDLPDGLPYTRWRFWNALWMFFNWCFLSVTTILTLAYLWHHPDSGIVYGVAVSFYPCLTAAAAWKARRLRGLLCEEEAEQNAEQEHKRQLQSAARRTENRMRATAKPAPQSAEVLCGG